MFDISAKVDYGLLVMIELANTYQHATYLSLNDIAQKHNLSEKYLSQLIISLKQSELVESKEGKFGGYKLGRAPEQVSLLEIIEALDGPVRLVRCMNIEKKCPADHECMVKPIWKDLNQDITKLLANKTLNDLLVAF